LTVFDEDEDGARAWKGYDWDALDRLLKKGYIYDPRNKAKSVVLTREGVKLARELSEQLFS
jgi:hypothetical protein